MTDRSGNFAADANGDWRIKVSADAIDELIAFSENNLDLDFQRPGPAGGETAVAGLLACQNNLPEAGRRIREVAHSRSAFRGAGVKPSERHYLRLWSRQSGSTALDG